MKSLILIIMLSSFSFFDCKVDEEDFAVPGCGIVLDVDGNSYKTVKIGGVCWLAENYKVNYLGSRVYDDLEENRGFFGGLYNTAMMKSVDFCPSGWHVSTREDWENVFKLMGLTYEDYGEWVSCGNMEGTWLKSILMDGAIGHNSPNWFHDDVFQGIDKYEMNLLPAGIYFPGVGYSSKGTKCYYLGIEGAGNQVDIEVHANDGFLNLSRLETDRFVSVRLVKN